MSSTTRKSQRFSKLQHSSFTWASAHGDWLEGERGIQGSFYLFQWLWTVGIMGAWVQRPPRHCLLPYPSWLCEKCWLLRAGSPSARFTCAAWLGERKAMPQADA